VFCTIIRWLIIIDGRGWHRVITVFSLRLLCVGNRMPLTAENEEAGRSNDVKMQMVSPLRFLEAGAAALACCDVNLYNGR